MLNKNECTVMIIRVYRSTFVTTESNYWCTNYLELHNKSK